MNFDDKSMDGSSILGVFGVLSFIAVLVLGMTRSFVSKKHERSDSKHTKEVPDWVDGQEY